MLLGIPELRDAIEVNATVGVTIRDQFLYDRLSIDIVATALRREHAQVDCAQVVLQLWSAFSNYGPLLRVAL